VGAPERTALAGVPLPPAKALFGVAGES